MHVMSYCSKSLIAQDQALQQVKGIVEASQRNNQLRGITGVLIYEGSNFVQVIEGERSDLEALIEKVKRDHRHTDFTLLADEPVSERQYSDWSMETFYVSDPSLVDLATIKDLSNIYQRSFTMRSRQYFEFIKQMVDQIDTFKIVSFQ